MKRRGAQRKIVFVGQSWIYWGVSVAALVLVMVVAWFPQM